MTELERQLTTALRALSEQYEMAQRQHSEEQQRQSAQVEALQQRIEQQDARSAALQQHAEQQDAQVGTLRRRVELLTEQMLHLIQDYETRADALSRR